MPLILVPRPVDGFPVLLIASSLIFFAAIAWRMLRVKPGVKSSTSQRLRTAKLLVGALLALAFVSFNLQHSLLQIDGQDRPPSLWEQFVRSLKKVF